jgi:hypothetical protein
MTTAAETAALYAAPEKMIGPKPATTLMEQLPVDNQYATKTNLGLLREDLVAFESALRSDLGERFDRVDERLDRMDQRFEKMDDRLYSFHDTLRGYSRTFVIAQVTSIFGAVGLFTAINKFF